MSSTPLRAGDAVGIRGERWRVRTAAVFGGVSIVEADGGDATNRGTRARFILPFEPVTRISMRRPVPRVVTPERWRRAARAVLADAVPHWTSLRAAGRARMAILPFQLEPAIAVTRGDACRILIADEVGLGKTVQAGLIVAETIARMPDARVLIVSPAGLRDQWRAELASRFDVEAQRLDAEGVARHAARLLPDVNPWSIHPVAITSIDYVKQPEVMRSLEALTWDVVVFDEAHALAGLSDRAMAAASLARRARVVVMLTATPHSGDADSFTRLCSLGDIDNGFPLRTFRRTRADVGLPHGRRSTRLRVRPSDAETAMYQALEHYIERLAGEHGSDGPGCALLGAVLIRRACSSAFSLERSLERRIGFLRGRSTPGSQLSLPFPESNSDDEPGMELGVPGLHRIDEEVELLCQLAELARLACASERKLHALHRFVRRASEPVLIFTEYRDTLGRLASVLAGFSPIELHGGLIPRERASVIRQFTSGSAAVLLATDAASEGLNLHERCRLVINLELPWTPTRLEQRIGRVDRLGQPRRVHAIHLVARGTREEAIAMRLVERDARIRTALDAPTNVASEADAEASRLAAARTLFSASSPVNAPPITVLTRQEGPSRIWAFRFSCADEDGHIVFETIAGIEDGEGGILVNAAMETAAAAHHNRLLATESMAISSWLDLAVRRETSVADALRGSHARLSAALLQPGLFDRRAERAAAAQASRVEEALRRTSVRLATCGRMRSVRIDERVAVFGAVFRT